MRRLGLLLCLVLLARADDERVVRIHAAADLKAEDDWWAAAVARVRALAQGGTVKLHDGNLVVHALPAVQELIEKELKALREAMGMLVLLEVRVVKVEGGLGVLTVPAEKLEALLKEKKAEALAGPALVCRNGQQAEIAVTRQITYVSDFDVELDNQGNAVADPVISTIEDGLRAKLRPFIRGQSIRVAVDVSISEVAAQFTEVELPLPLPTPLKVQVPERTTRSVARFVECPPGSHSVIDLGHGQVVLLKATAVRADEIGVQGFGGEEPQEEMPVAEEAVDPDGAFREVPKR